jgi:hypothetical protein
LSGTEPAAVTWAVSGWLACGKTAGVTGAADGGAAVCTGASATCTGDSGILGRCTTFITTAPPKAPAKTRSKMFTGFICRLSQSDGPLPTSVSPARTIKMK